MDFLISILNDLDNLAAWSGSVAILTVAVYKITASIYDAINNKNYGVNEDE